MIRSWTEEEKIKIQNGARFSAVLPLSYLAAPMIMEVELMFYELTNPKVAKFKSISITRYRVENYATGVYEYIPIVFNEDHFHLLNLTLYASVLDFKTKKNDQLAAANLQPTQLKTMYSQFVAPLRQAYINLNEFVNHMETDVDRKSHSALSTRYSIRNILPSSCLRDLEKRNYDPDVLTKQLATEFQIVESQLNVLWLKMLQLIKTKNPLYIRTLKKESIINHQLRFAQFTHREVIPVIDHIHTTEPELSKLDQDNHQCQQKRNQYSQDLNNTLFLAINNGMFGPSKVVDLKIVKEVKDKLVILEKHY